MREQTHTKARRRSWLKSGVTQDKSNCARWTQIANGDEGCSRVTSLPYASRSNPGIRCQHCVHGRLAFVRTLSDKWRPLTGMPNAHGRIRGTTECVR